MGARPGVATDPPPAATAPPLLDVDGVDFCYGRLQVLFEVSLSVPQGGRVALVGTNGAGKSTLLRVAAGLERPDRGTVRFAGRDVTRLPAEDRAALGVTLVEGGRATFPSLSLRENLLLGTFVRRASRQQADAALDRALDLFPALRSRLRQPAGSLSGGEQQMAAIARALVSDPRLLMIDELSLGLAPVVMEVIVEAVERLVADGVTLLLVEQSLNVAVALVDDAYFMEKGAVRFSGRAADLLERGDLVRSVFFGSEAGS